MRAYKRDSNEETIRVNAPYYAPSTGGGSQLTAASPRHVLVYANGLIVRALPTWQTPKKALREGKRLQSLFTSIVARLFFVGTEPNAQCGFLEVVNTRARTVQYLPVPWPVADHRSGWFTTASDVVRFVIARGSDERHLFTLDATGGLRRWEIETRALTDAYNNWRRQIGLDSGVEGERLEIQKGENDFDLGKLGDPKFGQIDPNNTPHVGGSNWAGGNFSSNFSCQGADSS